MNNILIMLSLLVLTGCSCGVSTHVSSQKQAPDYRKGEFYMKNAVKVDNEKFGPYMYRVENDEVICYVTASAGTGVSCKWKNSSVGNL